MIFFPVFLPHIDEPEPEKCPHCGKVLPSPDLPPFRVIACGLVLIAWLLCFAIAFIGTENQERRGYFSYLGSGESHLVTPCRTAKTRGDIFWKVVLWPTLPGCKAKTAWLDWSDRPIAK